MKGSGACADGAIFGRYESGSGQLSANQRPTSTGKEAEQDLPASQQFSLFGPASGKGLLFSAGALAQYLDDAKTTSIPELGRKAQLLRDWIFSLEDTQATEASLEARFLQDVFVGVLGYTLYPAGSSLASLYSKPPKAVTRIKRVPDALLGSFGENKQQITVAVELKTPGTDLDAPQAREGSETPVEQGLYYGRRVLGTKWVVVSDMRVLRLYSVHSADEYEEFAFQDCFTDEGAETERLRTLWLLLHHDQLVVGHDSSPVSLLYAKSGEDQFAVRDGFYSVYYQIRAELYDEICDASSKLDPAPSRSELLQATQRLLDRLLFIYYCEDHPQRLLPSATVASIAEAARRMPGPSDTKVYDALKHLFREVDTGSPPTSGVQVLGYNGELFKDHRIIDHISLPDRLHDRLYPVVISGGRTRTIRGVWGLHEFDFWAELNEHLLGHIFEESLSDLESTGTTPDEVASAKRGERKRKGIFYTSSTLSDFLSNSAILAVLNEKAPLDASDDASLASSLVVRLGALLDLRVLDPACGSGAFLVSAYREMLGEYWRLRSLQESRRKGAASLFDATGVHDQATLLRSCLFGIDLLPQAVEIAKLALWLRSARKGEKVADLGRNIVSGNSLNVQSYSQLLNVPPEQFDLVIGNPPWGSEVDDATYATAFETLGITEGSFDSWELFVLLGLRALRDGGRLAFVLPDSFLYRSKATTRARVFAESTIEKVYNLGPGWFGTSVRMGTVVLQVRKGEPDNNANMLAAVLAGELRDQAIAGQIPLTQIEAQRARFIPIARSLATESREIAVFRGRTDDEIMEKMDAAGIGLEALCDRARGEEMNKAGLAWECPSCLSPTVPGRKQKGGGYLSKSCPACSHEISASTARSISLVQDTRPTSDRESFDPFIDGDDLARRYQRVEPSKWLNVAISGWAYKPAVLYSAPKVLVRQSGVGIVATLDATGARCPQSIYLYRINDEHASRGYRHEFLLAALLSRTLAYYVFKSFGEIDPAKAHAKLTHERLSSLPVPKVDFTVPSQRRVHDEICEAVRMLLDGSAPLGGAEDRRIESGLRELWGVTPVEGAYINSEFLDVPDSQIVRDLFPSRSPGSN